MSSKRMFNSEIVGSDAFIEMPVSAQVLYFHLGMRADDDGFVNPQITMRMMGANGDDLRILLAKRFLLQFENGVVVVKHWRINNFIRKDRYKETNYIELKSTLRVKDNGAYTLDNTQGLPIGEVPWKSDSERRLTVGQPSVNAGEVRLGKVRIGKNSKKEIKPYQKLEYLTNIPIDDLNHLAEKYKISPKGIKKKAYQLFLWCETNGKRKKNYKRFIEVIISGKDKVQLQNDFPYVVQEVVKEVEEEVSDEQKEKIAGIKEGISKMVRSKKML